MIYTYRPRGPRITYHVEPIASVQHVGFTLYTYEAGSGRRYTAIAANGNVLYDSATKRVAIERAQKKLGAHHYGC